MRMSFKSSLVVLLTAGLIVGGSSVAAVAAATAPAAPTASPMLAPGTQGIELGNQGIINLILNVKHTLQKIRILDRVKSIRIITIQRSLNKVINRSDILSHRVIVLHHFLRNCNVLACFTIQNFLNKNDITVGNIVAVQLLSNDNIRLFQRP
jgi:hypothetical protein